MSSQTSEEKLPIDITRDKYLRWLVSRSKVETNWPETLKKIKKKIKLALVELPMDIKSKIDVNNINYFVVLSIMQHLEKLLADKGKNIKTFFGTYSDGNMKKWHEIEKCYKKNNTWLAEAGQILIQKTKYDIPRVRRALDQTVKYRHELQKKIESYQKAVEKNEKKHEKECISLGILPQSKHIHAEILQSAKKRLIPTLQSLIDSVSGDICKEAAEYYRDFYNYHFNTDKNLSKTSELLSILQIFQNESIIEQEDEIDTSSDQLAVEDGIDWGICLDASGETADTEENVIDWGATIDTAVENGENNTENHEIDWSAAIATENENDETAADADIDWGISIEETQNNQNQDNEDGNKINSDSNDTAAIEIEKISEKEDKQVSLKNSKTRQQFLTDLMELEAFLEQRIRELSDDKISQSLTINVPALIQNQSLEKVKEYKAPISNTIDKLRDPDTNHIIMITQSKLYLDRRIASLKKNMALIERSKQAVVDSKKRIETLGDTLQRNNEIVKELINSATDVKQKIEHEISQQYNGRKVTIMGTHL